MPNLDGPPSWMATITPGTLDARVLDQDRYWVTTEATVLPLAAMTGAHLAAVVRLLHARPTCMHMDAMVDALLDLIDARSAGETTPEQLTHDLIGQSIASVSADAWLESTALMRTIRRELAARG